MDDKRQIITALSAWIKQRPGLEFVNYDERSAYRSDLRRITRQRHDAEILLLAVSNSAITAEQLMAGFRAYSGRLTCTRRADGSIALDYCTGQYWPIEYRAAVCAVLAAALWDYHNTDYAGTAKNGESAGDAIRRQFHRRFGTSLATRWFN